ncbi:MAG: hypothetical protein R3B45_11560 [Bdellovibrionota bacterium]
MVIYIKSINRYNVLSAFLVVVFQLLLTQCGTEVGNGYSGPGEDAPEKQKSTTNKDDQETASDPIKDSAQPEVSESASNTGEDYSINQILAVLTAPCASPFGEAKFDNVDLINSDGVKLQSDFHESENRWQLKLNGVARALISDISDADFGVSVVDRQGQVLASSATCSAVEFSNDVKMDDEDGLFDIRYVIITIGDYDYRLRWYLAHPATDGLPMKLYRIEIDSENAGFSTSFVETISE